jgi:hypothetical protein
MKRRDFLKTGAALAVGSLTSAAKPVSGATAHLIENFSLPSVRLGTLTVSRLILGSNPFWGYSHKSPQLDEEMRRHHTDERIMQILDEAADCGLTALASPPDQRWVTIWARYLEKGGRLKIWISQCHGNPDQMHEEIDRSIKAGAKAIFIQGLRVEEQFGLGNFDVLRSWIEHIKEAGLPAGAAAHWPEVHPELERRQFPTDFYYQCLYNVSKSWKNRSSPIKSWRPEGSPPARDLSTRSTISRAKTASASASMPRRPSTRYARTPPTPKLSLRTRIR